MKQKHFLLLLLIVFLCVWIFGSLSNVSRAKNRPNIMLSPDKSKSAEVVDGIGSTQILVHFHKTFTVASSTIASGSIDKDSLSMHWQNDSTLVIKTALSDVYTSRETHSQYFTESVNVMYD